MLVLGTVYYLYLLLQWGKTALMYALEGGHIGCVKALLEKDDIDVNIQDKAVSISSTKAVICLESDK